MLPEGGEEAVEDAWLEAVLRPPGCAPGALDGPGSFGDGNEMAGCVAVEKSSWNAKFMLPGSTSWPGSGPNGGCAIVDGRNLSWVARETGKGGCMRPNGESRDGLYGMRAASMESRWRFGEGCNLE